MLRSSGSSAERFAYSLLPSFAGDGHLPFGFGVMLPALIAFSVAVAFFLFTWAVFVYHIDFPPNGFICLAASKQL